MALRSLFFSQSLRPWLVLLATVLAVALTARLGLWQLDRASQKLALQANLDQRGRLPALTEVELARVASQVPQQVQRLAQVRGRWLPAHTLFLDNRVMGERVGFLVLTPLQLASSNEMVLVQRGWLPRHGQDRTRVPSYQTSQEEVLLQARVLSEPSRMFEFKADTQGLIRQNIGLAQFAEQSGLKLLPLVLEQLDGAASDRSRDDGLLRQWPQPAVDIHKHYGYAVQWFGLSLLMLGLYVWFQLVRPRLAPKRQ
mgnify:CR=1 FL=1